jgi:hypothetical protein
MLVEMTNKSVFKYTNMKYKVLLFLTILSVTFSSCQRIFLGIYGVERNPKAKTKDEILNYISTKKLPVQNQFTVNNLGIEFFNKLSNELPECYLFDRNGNLLRDSSLNGCLNNRIDKFEKLIKYQYTSVDTTVNLDRIAEYINKDIKLNNEIFRGTLMDPQAQYYILFTWAAYIGKFNSIYYLKWYNKVLEFEQLYKIKIVNINLDFLKGLSYENLDYKPRN